MNRAVLQHVEAHNFPVSNAHVVTYSNIDSNPTRLVPEGNGNMLFLEKIYILWRANIHHFLCQQQEDWMAVVLGCFR